MPILLHGLLDANSIGIATSHPTTMLNNHGNIAGVTILLIFAILFILTVISKKQQKQISKRFDLK